MIRTSWNADGLLQIEISAEIAQELVGMMEGEGSDWSPDLKMLVDLMQERLNKPQRRRGDAQTET